MSQIAAECRNVTVYLNKDPVLRNVSVALAPGQCTVVQDTPDLSDTTLLRVFALLEKPAGGDMYMEGSRIDFDSRKELLTLRKRVAYLPQTGVLISNLTLLDNVTLYHRYHFDRDPAEARRHAMPLLERFRLETYLHARPADVEPELRKRAVAVREFLKDYRIAVLDHPRIAFSVQAVDLLVRFLEEEKAARGISILMSEDDSALIRKVGDRLIVLERGRVASDMPVSAGGGNRGAS